MIPYFETSRLTASILIAVAILTGHFLLLRSARRAGLDPATAAGFSAAMLAGGLLFGHWVKLLYVPDFTAIIQGHPGVMLRIFSGQASFGGLLGALLGGLAYLHWRGVSREGALRWFDLIALVFPYAWILGRAHCVAMHDHPGIRTGSWLGVRYPDGVRFDLAVLEILFSATAIATFALLRRRPRFAGFHCGAFLIAYGLFRLGLDQLHVDVIRYFGWSVDQWAASGAILAGGLFLGAGLWPARITFINSPAVSEAVR